MAPTTVKQNVLVYDRIDQNRRKTILLVAIAILSVIPFVAAVSYGAADWTLAQFGHRSISQAEADDLQRVIASQRAEEIRTEEDAQIEQQVRANIEKLRQARIENERLKWRVTSVFAFGVIAVLGLLFWSIASSPTSQVLAMCGARPAGPAEAEAKRILENLAIGAGLPTPKLYIIDSPVPNAFAAGMDPKTSVVAVTHGLLALMDHRELEGVLAHEISHIGNRDTRLNTVVTAIAIFLRLPYLMRKRATEARRAAENTHSWTPYRRRYRVYTLAMLPIYIYVFFIAPLLAAIIRAAISRSREYQADADAALLTRSPEGLLRALAKIRGAGSALPGSNSLIAHLYFSDPAKVEGLMSFYRVNLLATHPPLEDRINRLLEFNDGVPIAVLEAAARTGLDFARDHPVLKTPGSADTMAQDELSVLTTGTPMGRVYRVLSDTRVYDKSDLKSATVANLKAGALIVVFDNPGKFRQVLTHDQTFGYMPGTVKLLRVDMLPAEIHDPAARAAVLAQSLPAASEVRASGVLKSHGNDRLTPAQMALTTAVGLLVFVGIFLVMLKFGN